MPVLKAVIDTNVMVSVAYAKKGLAKELRAPHLRNLKHLHSIQIVDVTTFAKSLYHASRGPYSF